MDRVLHLGPYVIGIAIIYTVGLVIYRLTIHPLAHFPGPKWTAITRLYEGYYDVIQTGRYTFKIGEMHEEYGPIVRISPYEVHINDPAFVNTLYRQDAAFNKYAWAADAFAVPGATILTVAHNAHKARRQPLNAFFSKTKVNGQPNLTLIHHHLHKLCGRLEKYTKTETTFNLGAAMTAIARDIGHEFLLGKSYNSLDCEDFDYAMLVFSQGSANVWRLSKFIRWVAPLVQKLPVSLMMKVGDDDMKSFLGHLQAVKRDTRNLMAAATGPVVDKDAPRTMVHEIMDSKLPPSEKSFERIFHDVATITGAGFEPMATAIRLILFHSFHEPKILRRLRDEVASVVVSSTSERPFDLKALEQLPYLTAVLTEGLRMSPGTATRSARVAPNDIMYQGWCIPAGTAVGMSIQLLHFDENSYPEPKCFNPDRWANDNKTGNRSGFAPFSKGTRNCLGMHLAWAEMYLIVATLVHRFDFDFVKAQAEDFECVSDQFAQGTRGKGNLYATVKSHTA